VTSLQYSLIALGVGLVAAMFLYNMLQERRSRKQAERIFGLHQKDTAQRQDPVLPDEVSLRNVEPPDYLAETRIEPHIHLTDEDEGLEPDDWHPQAIAAEASPQPEPEPRFVAPPVEPAAVPPSRQEPAPAEPSRTSPPARTGVEPEGPLDGAIEYVARLRYAQPTALVFATLLDSLRRISKPIRLFGRREDGAWEPVLAHASRPYDTVELSLLLADRSGPLSEVQIDTFCRRLYEFATEHGGAVSCQDKAVALEQARILDSFCAEVDMLIGLNVVSSSGLDFSSQAIYELAVAAGLTQGGDGTYGLRDGLGRTMFTLATYNEMLGGGGESMQGTQGLSLLFDVPRVADGLAAFDRMAGLGFELAARLGGQLVDDGGRPVSRESLTKDRQRLEMIYARMAQLGIPAGGERALRLFA
jgi:FtsZ-interacting cell division protein ZipA